MVTLCLITPGDMAILMADTGTTPVISPARSYRNEAKVGG